MHVGFELLGILSFLSCLTELIREKEERETRGSSELFLNLFFPWDFSQSLDMEVTEF